MEIEEAISILGVSEDPSLEEINKAFKERVKIAHPDAGGNKEDFEKIVGARDKLLDLLRPTTSLIVVQDSIEKQQKDLIRHFNEIFLQNEKQLIRDQENFIRKEIVNNSISRIIISGIPIVAIIVFSSLIMPEIFSLLWRIGLVIWLFLTGNWTYLTWARNKIVSTNIRRLQDQKNLERFYVELTKSGEKFLPLMLCRKKIEDMLMDSFLYSTLKYLRKEEIELYIDTVIANLIEWGYIERAVSGIIPGFNLKRNNLGKRRKANGLGPQI